MEENNTNLDEKNNVEAIVAEEVVPNIDKLGRSYGTGKRISLKYTRSMVNAALNDALNNVEYEKHKNGVRRQVIEA